MYCFKLDNLDPNRFNKVKWIMESGIINKDVWLAGGSLRTLIDHKDIVCDYDLFFRQTSEIDSVAFNPNTWKIEYVREKLIKLGFKPTFECPEGKLYTYTAKNSYGDIKVQLICEFFYDSPEHLLSTFDLSPCTFATDGEFVWMYKEGIKDVKDKIVHVRNLVYPIPTMKRIIKYAGKGYETNVACQEFVHKLSNLIETKGISASELDRIYID